MPIEQIVRAHDAEIYLLQQQRRADFKLIQAIHMDTQDLKRDTQDLKHRVMNLEAGQARLEAGQAELQAGQAELRAGMALIADSLNILIARDKLRGPDSEEGWAEE